MSWKAGTTAPAMWRALEQQGAFGVSNKITTGLAERATWSTFGDVAAKIDFLSHYVSTAPKNKVNDFLVNSMRKRNQVPDLFTTNLCFGGPDMQDVWITASSTGKIYKGRWPRPGLKLAFNA